MQLGSRLVTEILLGLFFRFKIHNFQTGEKSHPFCLTRRMAIGKAVTLEGSPARLVLGTTTNSIERQGTKLRRKIIEIKVYFASFKNFSSFDCFLSWPLVRLP